MCLGKRVRDSKRERETERERVGESERGAGEPASECASSVCHHKLIIFLLSHRSPAHHHLSARVLLCAGAQLHSCHLTTEPPPQPKEREEEENIPRGTTGLGLGELQTVCLWPLHLSAALSARAWSSLRPQCRAMHSLYELIHLTAPLMKYTIATFPASAIALHCGHAPEHV